MVTVKARNTSEYKEFSVEETLKLLETSTEGLTESEAKHRAEMFGFNEVAEKKRSRILDFLSAYWWGPVPWLLELAIVVSVVLKDYLDAIIIFILFMINSILGQIQARNSQKVLETLKKRLSVQAKILRDGEWVIRDAREIVSGDITFVGLGNVVPADAKIVSGELSVDQSILTGESLPVSVQQSAIIYSGSIVREGEAECVVVNTGANTHFGRTAELVKIAKPKSHQEQIMLSIIKYTMSVGIAGMFICIIYGAVVGIAVATIFTLVLILLLGSVPMALPAVLTVVQANGARELARKSVLVTRIDSIEDAASVDVLCLDKTGTITQNRLSVTDVIPFSRYKKEDVILMASLASREVGKDAIDAMVIEQAKAAKVDLKPYKQVSFTPFAPATKRAEAIIAAGDKQFRVLKGAPQMVISLCTELDDGAKENVTQMVQQLSLKGYRALAVAKSEDDMDNIELVGLLSLADPVRPESREMIEGAKRLGVKPMMLTGDNIAIAKEIARQASIGDKIMTMGELKGLTEKEQAELVTGADGFAEIYPEDKYKIVRLLQSQGHMVGMTGDGVNDAPALKQAEMGIAVSNATDVAKASASMVLTEPGVKVIIDAIETSRKIYERMLTWVINRVTKSISIFTLLIATFIWFDDIIFPLLAIVILMVPADFVTMSLATDNVRTTANPNKWNLKNITFASLVIGVPLLAGGIGAIIIGDYYLHLEWGKLCTFAVLMVAYTGMLSVFILRERDHFWSSRPGRALVITTTAAIIVFILIGLFAQGTQLSPLAPYLVFLLLGFSALLTFSVDFVKYWAFRRFKII
jgi:H+-transporting ATPase